MKQKKAKVEEKKTKFFNVPNVSTDGIEMEKWVPEDDKGRNITLSIWDFAGQEGLFFFFLFLKINSLIYCCSVLFYAPIFH